MREIGFRDYVRVLVKWRRVVVFNVVIITAFAVVLSLVLPKRYTAKATLLPPLETQSFQGLGSMLAGGHLSGLAGMAGFPGMATTSDVFAAILGSPTVLREVVKECDLLTVYETKSFEDAVGRLREKTKIQVSAEGIISVSATARRPKLAATIANAFVGELDRFNRETTMTMGKRQRVFLQERLKQAQESLADAEDDLRHFQEEHRTVSLTEELTQAIEAAAELKAVVMMKEIELGVLTKYATEENPQVRRLRSEILELRRELRRMEYGDSTGTDSGSSEFGAGFSVPFADLPAVGLRLARLTREARIQEEVYALLVQQYEQAKIEEVRDTPTVQKLDEALPPEGRSFPRRTRIVLLAGFLSVVAGVGMAFFFEHLERLKKRHEEYEAWRFLMGQVSGDLRAMGRKLVLTKKKLLGR
jgi:uncharacterized protein involved in exopolysaccharide biosynthesis